MIKRNDILALQRAIEALPGTVSRDQLARAIADVIEAGNPKFKRAEFIKNAHKPSAHVERQPTSPFDPALDERLASILDEN